MDIKMAYKIKRKKYSDVQLPIEQVVYVPTTNKYQKPIKKKEIIKRVNETEKYMSEKFGGFTQTEGEGGFVSGRGKTKGKLIRENVIKVTSFTTKENYRKNKASFFQKLRKDGKKWGQESIGYEHEGDLTYLKSENGE